MWLSCSCFFHQYYRNYGTTTFPAKYDKTGKLVRKYVPELKDYPDKYIYKPWEAPDDVQKKAGSVSRHICAEVHAETLPDNR